MFTSNVWQRYDTEVWDHVTIHQANDIDAAQNEEDIDNDSLS